MLCTVYFVLYAIYYIIYIICYILDTICCMLYAICCIQYAIYCIIYTRYCMLYAICYILYAICYMLDTIWYMLTYDVVEYGLCEHRRLLDKARRRQKGRSLSTCKFTVTHRAAILQARSSSLSRRSIKHIELPNPDRNRWTWCATQSL